MRSLVLVQLTLLRIAFTANNEGSNALQHRIDEMDTVDRNKLSNAIDNYQNGEEGEYMNVAFRKLREMAEGDADSEGARQLRAVGYTPADIRKLRHMRDDDLKGMLAFGRTVSHDSAVGLEMPEYPTWKESWEKVVNALPKSQKYAVMAFMVVNLALLFGAGLTPLAFLLCFILGSTIGSGVTFTVTSALASKLMASGMFKWFLAKIGESGAIYAGAKVSGTLAWILYNLVLEPLWKAIHLISVPILAAFVGKQNALSTKVNMHDNWIWKAWNHSIAPLCHCSLQDMQQKGIKQYGCMRKNASLQELQQENICEPQKLLTWFNGTCYKYDSGRGHAEQLCRNPYFRTAALGTSSNGHVEN